MAEDNRTTVSLLNIAKEIRDSLPAAVQEKYSTRDIHRTLALLLVRAGDIARTETGYEPTSIGADHGIEEPEDDSRGLRFTPAGVSCAKKCFYKAYPNFAPAVLSDFVLSEFRESGELIPSFEYHGKTVRYKDQSWFLDALPLQRDRIPWAEKQFSSLIFELGPGPSILDDIGDRFRENGPKRLAAYFYEEAYAKSEGERKKKILAKLASVYRQLHMPLRTLNLYESMSEEELASVQSVPFLVAVGSACCDINNYITAKEIAEKALALGNGRLGADLSVLYRRIRSGNGTGK